ncbi:MAG: hypothetical protein CSYNP_01578 [Syntrophus sp. SKADARSKE-3]|nr:hypothetical protein [Syntrophus sp. SKADARSKE-3]
MSKMVADAVLDAALNYLKNNVTTMVVCSAQPANYSEATGTYDLATKTGLTSSDFTVADDTSGRKVTLAEQDAITVDHTSTATHIALCAGSVLLYVTTCTSKALEAGDKVDCPAWKINIQDPS